MIETRVPLSWINHLSTDVFEYYLRTDPAIFFQMPEADAFKKFYDQILKAKTASEHQQAEECWTHMNAAYAGLIADMHRGLVNSSRLTKQADRIISRTLRAENNLLHFVRKNPDMAERLGLQ